MTLTKYFFLASKSFSKKALEVSLSSFDVPFRINYKDDISGIIESENTLGTLLSASLFTIHDDLGTNITLLEAPKECALVTKLLKEALSFFPNQVVFLTDLLLKEWSFGDFSSIPLLSQLFKDVPHEVLLTAGAFLRSGLNATLTAETLYIHRNTFNYRLRNFIEITGLDIREYHNAMLLEFYFELCSSK